MLGAAVLAGAVLAPRLRIAALLFLPARGSRARLHPGAARDPTAVGDGAAPVPLHPARVSTGPSATSPTTALPKRYIPNASRFQASGQCREPAGTCSRTYSGRPSPGSMRRPAHATTPSAPAFGHANRSVALIYHLQSCVIEDVDLVAHRALLCSVGLHAIVHRPPVGRQGRRSSVGTEGLPFHSRRRRRPEQPRPKTFRACVACRKRPGAARRCPGDPRLTPQHA